ncbi:MAG: glycoside hydrolase family 3 C-terminal domain-containing protein, partial [Anaerolineae bacterium]|nr:glycoside hydrolase family 3 C-terminal domain-containing protein [Anaerolineae bacterium]
MSIDRKPLLDPQRTLDERVDYLYDQMNLDEKIAQLAGIWASSLTDEDRRYSQDKADSVLKHGTGHITRVSAATFLPPDETAKLANRIQKHLVENTRLSIPAIIHEESCAGLMARGATSFPQSIGLAATFEPDLIEKMSSIIRQQMRAIGAHHTLAPVLDVVRDPRWGRVEETYGEDPFLISNLGVAYIKGIQSDDIAKGIVATGKHFAGHGVPQGGRNWGPVTVNKRELREIFLTPFKAAIQEADLASMMNAYHEWDGIPIGASREMMVDILRHELGFDGVVVSDYFTLRTLVTYHYVAKDAAEAARLGLEAGIDIELPFADCYAEPLKQALENDEISIDLIEASVKRVLKMKFELNLFENPYVDEGSVLAVYNTPDQIALSRELAQKSIVLLKNDELLPLKKSVSKIAVIGPGANSVRHLQGDYHYPAHTMHVFQQMINENQPMPQDSATKPFSWDDHFPPTTTILNAIRSKLTGSTDIQYATGCDVLSEDRSGFDEAVSIASNADVAVLVLGDESGLGKGSSVGESIDSATLRLPGVQQDLLEAIHATGTSIVLVCVTGRPYNLTWADEHIAAIVEAWLPAQEGGNAIADVLFGDINPGGKLPMTFPRSVGQVPLYYNHKPSGARSNWHTDYMDMSVKPLYAFGHGLSYTQFEYSDLSLSQTAVVPSDTITIQFKLTNTGDVAGEEVVQLYIADPIASATRPVKQLKAFKRIGLQAGQTKAVSIELPIAHFAFYDVDMNYIVESGTVQVMIGSASD